MRALLLSATTLLGSAALLPIAVAGAAEAPVAPAADPVADQIVVTASRASKTARAEERAAPNLINVQAAEDIVKYPDFNAAEALGRVPGVSLAIDTGEGRFVTIRGIDSNLNGTTFGGTTLLNTQPGGTYFGGGGRAVELDTIPIGSVDRIVVRKTGLPDQEAEGLGGSVELTPRTAAGLKGPFFEGAIGGGYQPAHKNGDVFVGEAAVGTTFGPDRKFAIVLTGSFHTDKRGFDDVEPGLLDLGADGGDPLFKSVTLDTVDLRRYNYNRRRFGFGGELSFDPSPGNHFYIRANDAGYTESVNRQLLQYRSLGDDTIIDPANRNGLIARGVTARTTLRDEQETHINFITAAGGRNDLGGVVVDYQLAYTAATYHRDYDYNAQFRTVVPDFNVAYDNVTNPLFPKLVPLGFNPGDPAQFRLRQLTNATERAFDREYSGVLNVTIPTRLLGGDGSFKFGGKFRLRDKIDQPNNLNYAVPTPFVSLSSLLGPGPFTQYYNGNYNIGYSPSATALRGVFNGITPTVNAARNAGGFFNDTENVYAGFAQYAGTFGKLGVLAGVRVENTEGTYRGLSTVIDKDLNTSFVPTSRKSNYTDVFPTVQLRYEVMDNLIARAVYSTGISRPGFLQLNAGARVDQGPLTVSTGNPHLKPITGNNFDASVEYYLPDSGVLSFGIFDKEFNNYVLQRTTRQDPNYPGFISTTYSNVKDAYARGVEAQYTQKLVFLPAPFDGLGVNLNATYVKSKIKIRGDINNPDEFAQLPGTSKFTYNIAAFYEARRLQLRLAFLHVDAAIFGVGSAAGLDTFEAARNTLDLTSSYQLLPHTAVYFNVKNLTNESLRYYEGSSNRTVQREFYEQSYEAGFRFKF